VSWGDLQQRQASSKPEFFWSLDITLSRAIYLLARLAVLSTVLAMSAGMINQEGVNVDLYIPRKCAAVPA